MSDKYELGSNAEDEHSPQSARDAYNSLRNERRKGKYLSYKKLVLLIIFVLVVILICCVVTWYLTKKHYYSEGTELYGADKDDGEAAAVQVTPTSATVAPTLDPSLPWGGSKLPLTLVPLDYKLALRVDLDKFAFNGSVDIRFTCAENTKHIVVHVLNLDIDRKQISVTSDANETLPTNHHFEVKQNNYFVTVMNNELEKGKTYVISFGRFAGPILDDLFGLYRSSYTTSTGEKR